jgi:predicted O-methyltransferase YrrM
MADNPRARRIAAQGSTSLMKHLDLAEPALARYGVEIGTRETALQRRLREETARLPRAQMQVSPDQGQLLAFLVGLIGARPTIEIRTFTGYSAHAVAAAQPPEGRLIACDVSAEWTEIAKRYWREAGIENRIDLRLAPALETLDDLIASGDASRFDFAFIDADKEGYDAYYELCLALIRPGGLIAVDNVLWRGSVVDPEAGSSDARFIDALNRKIRSDDRVDMCLVPIGDGLTLVRRR